MTRVQELAATVRDQFPLSTQAVYDALYELEALAEVGAEHAEEYADWRTMRAERAELREALKWIVSEHGSVDEGVLNVARAALKIGEE